MVVYASIEEIAKAEEINPSYVSRILRLTLLTPTIIEAILDGRQSSGLTLSTVTKPFSVMWNEQLSTADPERIFSETSAICPMSLIKSKKRVADHGGGIHSSMDGRSDARPGQRRDRAHPVYAPPGLGDLQIAVAKRGRKYTIFINRARAQNGVGGLRITPRRRTCASCC